MPLADTTMSLTSTADTTQSFTTGDDGSFAVTVSQPQIQEEYAVSYAGSVTVSPGSSTSIEVTSQVDPVTLTAQVSSSQVNYGATVTITGKATYESGSAAERRAAGPD